MLRHTFLRRASLRHANDPVHSMPMPGATVVRGRAIPYRVATAVQVFRIPMSFHADPDPESQKSQSGSDPRRH